MNQQAAFNQKQSTSVHACTASQAKPTHSFKHSCIWLTALVYLASYSRSSSRTRSLISHALTFTLSTCSHAKAECLLSLSPSHSHLPLSWTSRTEVEDHNLRISPGVELEPTDHEGEYARSDDPQADAITSSAWSACLLLPLMLMSALLTQSKCSANNSIVEVSRSQTCSAQR